MPVVHYGVDRGNSEAERCTTRERIEYHCEAGSDSDAARDGRLKRSSESSGEQGRPDAAEHGCAEHGFIPVGARLEGHAGDVREWRGPGWLDPITARSIADAGATRNFWADCDWWYGRDGKYRPIGSGLQPLAHGSPARVGRLRMYGDAIVVPVAQAFVESYLDAVSLSSPVD